MCSGVAFHVHCDGLGCYVVICVGRLVVRYVADLENGLFVVLSLQTNDDKCSSHFEEEWSARKHTATCYQRWENHDRPRNPMSNVKLDMSWWNLTWVETRTCFTPIIECTTIGLCFSRDEAAEVYLTEELRNLASIWSPWDVVEHRPLLGRFSGVSPNFNSNSLTSWLSCKVVNPWKILHSNSSGSPSILSKFLHSWDDLNHSNLSSHASFDWGFSCILPRHNTESEKT